MAEAVLDASAVIAHLRDEAGADDVAELLSQSLLSAVNLSEVVKSLADLGMADTAISQVIGLLPCRIVAFDGDLAMRAGWLRRETRTLGLSLGDRACLALAEREGLPAVTADRVWSRLDLSVEVRLIR